MTVKGRTITERRHRVGGRLDPDVHGVRFYPTIHEPKPPEPPEPKVAILPGRRGAAERALSVRWALSPTFNQMALHIATEGWYVGALDIDERQARFLRDTLNEWFPPE